MYSATKFKFSFVILSFLLQAFISQNIIVAISQLRGDPHITTFDGLSYTFNGHGEFILVKSTDGSNFHVQVHF